MAELGEAATAFHAEIGAAARTLGVDVVIAVGGDLAAGYGGRLVATPADAAAALRTLLEPGDVVLVKGSRAARLESVAEALAGAPV
jgi:UDP-N-acetylmuramoyl-tripeptide--D-alanyl-D-alanine ligase